MRYESSESPFEVQLIGLAAAGPTGILMNFFTNQMKNPRISTYLDLAAISVSAPVCFYLIPKYGIMGGAWGSSAAYVSQFLISFIFYEMKAGKGSLLRFSSQDWIFLRRKVSPRHTG